MMKVLCISLGSDNSDLSGWLTLHKEYTVLEIVAVPQGRVDFRVLADDGRTPGLVDSSLFSASSPQPLPSSWVSKVGEDGILTIAPARWHDLGYWERFFDGEEEAILIFHEEMHILLEE